ncbi:MAG: hypothetical protein AB7Q16_18290 [Vicinamibacterales bacterium]
MLGRLGVACGLTLVGLALGQGGADTSVLGRIDFDAPPYQLATWRGTKVDLRQHDRRGPKARGHLWDWEPQAGLPGAGGHVRFHWWEYKVANSGPPGEKWEDNAGFYFRGSGIEPPDEWQEEAEYFGRVRIRIVQPMRPDPEMTGNTATNKWLITNGGHHDGDHRLMLHLTNTGASEPCVASSRRFPQARYTAVRISKNIGDQCAGSVLRTGEWEDVQWSWRMGPAGRAFVRLWVNNNDYARPTSQHVFSEPWIMERGGMNSEWHVGGYYSDELEADASWDLDDFEIATSFDATWSRQR